MKIKYEGHEYELTYGEYDHVFALYDDTGEMIDRMDPAGFFPGLEPNTAYVDEMYLSLLMDNKVVEPIVVRGERIEVRGADDMTGTLCQIIHPEFNDQGFSSFGDFSRERLGQQCQYGSRYIEGRLDRYPNLGEGLRFNNGRGYGGEILPLDSKDYHSVRIHRDDMAEFESRYNAYQAEQMGGF